MGILSIDTTMSLLAMVLVLVIGLGVGLIMGLTGAGGGMLAVPALVYTQHWTMQQAMPVALLAVSSGAVIGAIDGFRRKQVRYKAALLMALVGAPMTSIGVWLAQSMSQANLMLAFSAVLLIVVVRLLRQAAVQATLLQEVCNHDALARVSATTGRFEWTMKTAGVISIIGACSGFATGALGVGGGFIIVPLLRHFTNLSMQSAAATSLMVISLVGTVAVGSAVLHGAQLPLVFSVSFALSSIAGVVVGRRLARFLPAQWVQRLFALMLLCVAVSLLWKAL